MISDKKLYEIMIKYHPIFVGWLIKEKKILLLDDKLCIYTERAATAYRKEYDDVEILNSATL